MKKKVIHSKKAVIIGCGFVGSASVFALMQSGLFTRSSLVSPGFCPAPADMTTIAASATSS